LLEKVSPDSLTRRSLPQKPRAEKWRSAFRGRTSVTEIAMAFGTERQVGVNECHKQAEYSRGSIAHSIMPGMACMKE
jgi:hypothetical protein